MDRSTKRKMQKSKKKQKAKLLENDPVTEKPEIEKEDTEPVAESPEHGNSENVPENENSESQDSESQNDEETAEESDNEELGKEEDGSDLIGKGMKPTENFERGITELIRNKANFLTVYSKFSLAESKILNFI